jgi:hypothetical protein
VVLLINYGLSFNKESLREEFYQKIVDFSTERSIFVCFCRVSILELGMFTGKLRIPFSCYQITNAMSIY